MTPRKFSSQLFVYGDIQKRMHGMKQDPKQQYIDQIPNW